MVRRMHVDVETFSTQSIKIAGGYKYAENSILLMMAVKYNDGRPAVCYDLTRGPIPEHIVRDLCDPSIIKYAFNATFERNTIGYHLGRYMEPEQWRCTMVRCAMCGLPMSLDESAKALGVANQKDSAGTSLINLFSIPCKPTKANGGRTRNLPHHFPERWSEFLGYCRQDVETEYDIHEALSFYEIPEREQRYWTHDQRMGDRGINVSLELATKAQEIDAQFKAKFLLEAQRLTGLSNPVSPPQIKGWLSERLGREIKSVAVDELDRLEVLFDRKGDPEAVRAIQLRKDLSKTSVAKYGKLFDMVCRDGRVHHVIQYYGAGRTGRGAGRGVQVHNLPKGEEYENYIDTIRGMVLRGEGSMLDFLYGPAAACLSALIRSAFISSSGKVLNALDFSAIEARVTAWLSGEEWRMEVFRTHGMIYEASAAEMFGVDIKSISYRDENGKKVNGPNYGLRAKGKIGELALGFGGSVNAIMQMDKGKSGMTRPEMAKIVRVWRIANPNIVAFWKKMDDAALKCIETGETVPVGKGISFSFDGKHMYITLPSGRKLTYWNAHTKILEKEFEKFIELEDGTVEIVKKKFTKNTVCYWGLQDVEKKGAKSWSVQTTYGGKLTENIVQAIARDLMYNAIDNITLAGYDIVMHVHDEVVVDGRSDDMPHLKQLMSKAPMWATGLPLGVSAFTSEYYKK